MIQQKLINLRKKTGLTQEQMAKSIAMEQTTYSRKELGKSSITNDEWLRIAKALNTSVEDLKENNDDNLTDVNFLDALHDVKIPRILLDTVLKYNAKLEEENKALKEELSKRNGV